VGTFHDKGEKMEIIVIAHNSYPFQSNQHAVLIATGIKHHIVWLLKT
jgi:hypothetical protein